MSELNVIDVDKMADVRSLSGRFYRKYEADKVIARHKYRRCLAMAYAEWLKQMNLWNYPESILYRRAVRRERKWKEMAQKFKEADDGNR